MPTYTITWTIDLEAEDPRRAIEQALQIQRDPRSQAVVFDVRQESGRKFRIDLADEDDYTGRVVLTRDGAIRGIASGATRKCMLEGCPSQRVRVDWPNGSFTYPCARGLKSTTSGDLQIE